MTAVEEFLSLTKSLGNFDDEVDKIEKGRGYPVGTIREWKGKKFQKKPNGKWVEKTGGRQSGAFKVDQKTKNNSALIGNTISFTKDGKTIKGKVVSAGKSGVTVHSIDKDGKETGVMYRVNSNNIKEIKAIPDGQIAPHKFNAQNYKLKYTDPKATNSEEGYEYIYSLVEGGDKIAEVTKSRLAQQKAKLDKVGDTRYQYGTVEKIPVLDKNGKQVYKKNGKPKFDEIVTWNKDRIAKHEEIINKWLSPEAIKNATPKNGEQPKFVMFGGRGGSGKSWFTDKKRAERDGRQVMFDTDNYIVLDADAIKADLKPPYEGWNAGEVHEESSYLNKVILKKAKELGLNIIIDGTMNYSDDNPDKVKNQMLDFKNAGYRTEAHYMFLPVQESAKRAVGRFSKGGTFTGRLVPMDILLGMKDNEKSFDSVKSIVDDWSFRDNQGSDGPKLVSQKSR